MTRFIYVSDRYGNPGEPLIYETEDNVMAEWESLRQCWPDEGDIGSLHLVAGSTLRFVDDRGETVFEEYED